MDNIYTGHDVEFSQPRQLTVNDYHKKHTLLLSQLTDTTPCSFYNFQSFVRGMNNNIHYISVIEHFPTGKIVATGTVYIETKIIHGFGKVGHIEDVIVDETFRGEGLGKKIIDKLIQFASNNMCYKLVLSSTCDGIQFYEKCGFIKKEQSMMKYLK